jgi:outer membrane protein insertion porin family
LTISSAAYQKVCVQFCAAARRPARARFLVRIVCAAAFVFCLAAGSPANILETRAANSSSASASQPYLFIATLDKETGETRFEAHPTPPEQAQPQADQPQLVIERIDFLGNRRIRSDTLKARIFSREGDPYNEETLRRDFQALWNTQFFEDVRLRVEASPDRPNARIIVFEVKERPVIRRIRYEGIHSVSESDILDRFKEKKVGLTVESQFDPTRIKKAEVVLKDLLGEHGHQFAKVTPQYERIASSNAVILVFKIVEGPKVKVGSIKFKGNHAFSDRKLIRSMRNDRPYGIPLYFWNIAVLSKTYDRQKLAEDMEVGIRSLYQDNGYFKAVIQDPILENLEVNHIGIGLPVPGLGPHKGKVVNITIPIEEGDRFHMGSLRIVSADPDKALSLKVDALKGIFPLKPGDIFAANKARKAIEDYGKAYGEFGFIDFTAEPQFDIDEDKKIINLTLKFDEQKQYYVRRINFSGNTTTRDKVIRRELLLDEGQLFNKRAWEVSILRLNQLDYFDRIEADKAAEIKRNTKEGTVDITLKLKEKGKQSIGLQGGVSGLSGSFIGLTYQTNNFIGLGETLTFSAQFGDLQRLFQFGFTQPYLFDRPISTGFTIFSSRYKYDQARQAAIAYGQSVSINPNALQNYNQDSTGFTAFASYPLRRFSFTRVGVTYGLSRTNITAFNASSKALFTELQYRTVAGPSALDGIISSTITPTITYNTIDNPINSTRGKSLFYSLSFEGGPLGGNVNAITNTFEYKMFHPINKRRNAIGFRVQTAFTSGFGGKQIPPYSRFYVGGENDLRGFDVRAITPISYIPIASSVRIAVPGGSIPVRTLTNTITFPGADFSSFGNLEYRIPIAGPVSMALFADLGTDGILRKGGLLLNQAAVDRIKQDFPQSLQSQQLQIAQGTNFKLRMSTGIEFIVNLPIVQAPFRIYYAYNPLRLRQQIVAPDSLYNNDDVVNGCSAAHISALDCELLVRKPLVDQLQQNPGRLNYFEPKSTFRFTVSRTF